MRTGGASFPGNAATVFLAGCQGFTGAPRCASQMIHASADAFSLGGFSGGVHTKTTRRTFNRTRVKGQRLCCCASLSIRGSKMDPFLNLKSCRVFIRLQHTRAHRS
jgi:hypothetical protein